MSGESRRCGVCLFELDGSKAKPLAVDIGSDWHEVFYRADSREFRFDGLTESARRGCAYCRAIEAHLRAHGKPSSLTTGYWSPQSDIPGLQLEDPSGRLEFCIPPEHLPEDMQSIHPSITRGVRLAGSTGDDIAMERAAAWLRSCRDRHEQCRSPGGGFMPTCLLFIGEQEPAAVRLVEDLAATPQVYAALSHRWSPETLAASLNQGNLQDRRENGIGLSLFPPMLRDVMYVLRRLGIYYVWIDCMCIIQGDADDWRAEAARMASIYANADLTVAATWCQGSGQRLFSERGGKDTIPVDGAPLFIRSAFPHLSWAGQEYGAGAYGEEHMADWPLIDRGWVYQERILSRRMLHFSREELSWECEETSACECGRFNFGHGKSHPAEKAAVTSRPWDVIVGEYSSRDFTFISDRLPALAGIAAAFGEAFGWAYVAGMWMQRLGAAFCWRREGPPAARPGNGAPSWSWASTRGSVSFWSSGTSEIEFDEYSVVYRGDTYMGDVEGAELTVTGSVFAATMLHGAAWADAVNKSSLTSAAKTGLLTWDKGEGGSRYGLQVQGRLVTIIPDYLLDGDVLSASPVLCLLFGSTSIGENDPAHPEDAKWAVLACCVVLRCVDEQKSRYERVGYFEGWDWDNGLDKAWVESISDRRQLVLI